VSSQLEVIMGKIKVLENELIEEIQNQHQEFLYIIDKSTIYFEENTLAQHKKQAKRLVKYFADASLKTLSVFHLSGYALCQFYSWI